MPRGIDQKARQLRDKIKADIDLGTPDLQIAEKYGCCIALVGQLRREKGIFKKYCSDRIYNVIYGILETAKTYRQIADEQDITPSSVHGIAQNLKKAGFNIPIRRRGRPIVFTDRKPDPPEEGIELVL